MTAHRPGTHTFPPKRNLRVGRIAGLLITLLLAFVFGANRAGVFGSTGSDPPAFQGVGYWHTSGNRILDQEGHPIRIAAANWTGMQDIYSVPDGLDRAALDEIMARIRGMGFNAIRLPFSNQMVEDDPVVTLHLDANPLLKGLHALDVLDRIVASARAHSLRIILDNQRSSNRGEDAELNGLWYTPRYPESSWIADWQLLARRYKGDPTVVGMDLRNEPHTGPPGPFTIRTYLTQGATWGPYNGVETPSTDWRLAAERGGNALLTTNPHLLIFVEGIQQYPDPSQPRSLDSYWWGGLLSPARLYPVVFSAPHQLVYSPHEYGPFKYQQMPFFGPHMSYATQLAVWEQHWGFLEQPSSPQQAPLFIGEFGTCGQPQCVSDNKPGSHGLWFQFLMRFLRSHPEIGWGFWAVNGTNHRGADMTNYLLNTDWKTIRLPFVVNDLRQIDASPS